MRINFWIAIIRTIVMHPQRYRSKNNIMIIWQLLHQSKWIVWKFSTIRYESNTNTYKYSDAHISWQMRFNWNQYSWMYSLYDCLRKFSVKMTSVRDFRWISEKIFMSSTIIFPRWVETHTNKHFWLACLWYLNCTTATSCHILCALVPKHIPHFTHSSIMSVQLIKLNKMV